MSAAAQPIAGFIELPAEGPWSADALVKECLGLCAYEWDRKGRVLSGRLPVSDSFESTRLFADFPQLQSDLQDLFEQQD